MNDRYVVIDEVPADRAPGLLSETEDMSVPEPVKFAVEECTCFVAEHALVDRDFIVHFFVSDRMVEGFDTDVLERWWLNDFARALSDVAQDHFQATLPRIMAKYTPEVASWWFKAQGYDHLLDPSGFLRAFFSRLDETLRSGLAQPRAR